MQETLAVVNVHSSVTDIYYCYLQLWASAMVTFALSSMIVFVAFRHDPCFSAAGIKQKKENEQNERRKKLFLLDK